MILTVDEFKEMGFQAVDEELTSDCIKRAEFVLNGLSGGKAVPTALAGGAAADYVKQACAFQANAILRKENALRMENGELKTEKVTIGDFSYQSTGDSSADEPFDTNFTVIRLLRAAGCLYTGTEVCE